MSVLSCCFRRHAFRTGFKKAIGPQVIEKLVKHNNQLEVVAMSGDLSRPLMESCLKAGAQRFLAKPYNSRRDSVDFGKNRGAVGFAQYGSQCLSPHNSLGGKLRCFREN